MQFIPSSPTPDPDPDLVSVSGHLIPRTSISIGKIHGIHFQKATLKPFQAKITLIAVAPQVHSIEQINIE